MRILNRMVAAGTLVVPMVLGAAGVAAADVAAGSSVLPSQIGAVEPRSDECDTCPCDDEEGDGNFLNDEDCREDGHNGHGDDKDDKDDGGLLGGLT
jgi:hypothetical protein